MLNISLILSGSVLLMLGFAVLYSNPKSPVNRTLGAFIFSGFLWLLANLLANLAPDPESLLIFSKLTLVGAASLPLFFLLFCYNFSGYAASLSKAKFRSLFILPSLIIVTTPTSLNVRGLDSNNIDFQPGLIYWILVPLLVTYFSLGVYQLIRSYKSASLTRKQQLRYIFMGIGLTFIPGVIINGILPLFDMSGAASYGSNVVIFFTVFTSIAIIRHRLLDIRLIVARSIAYILLLSSLVGLYAASVFVVAANLFDNNRFAEQMVPIVAALALVFVAPVFRRYIDRVTNKFFYRDAYEPQVFLDQFNRILVSNADLQPLLEQAAATIEDNLKSDYCVFSIRDTSYISPRMIGGNKRFSHDDLEILRNITPKAEHRLIITDELDENEKEIANLLRKHDVAVLARLVSNAEYEVEGSGYLILGPKKSGNLYNKQDINIIQIIANELVIAIQNALRFEEIEKFNVTLQEKVDDATRQLRRTNEKLKALDETKDEFISMASHQLRTPLTSVKGYLSMVLEGDTGKITAPQRKMLDQAFISSQRMVYLIADLLNVSRLRTGKFIIEAVPMNLADILQGEVGQLITTAAARNLELSYDKPDNFPLLMLDETKIRQVLMNFIDNAIHYTPSGGHIKVELKDLGHSIEFTVTDDGIGVPRAEQHHLFNKFYRAGNARKSRPDGTGLGLFMAKKVIVAQGGSVIFKSVEGKGSTFGFTFSKAKLLPPAHTES